MTYEKAARALVDAGILAANQLEAAVMALDQTNGEFTYPAWADALVSAGLIDEKEAARATAAMEDAGWAEADDDPGQFDKGLESADLLE